jgi:hypothetical protein
MSSRELRRALLGLHAAPATSCGMVRICRRHRGLGAEPTSVEPRKARGEARATTFLLRVADHSWKPIRPGGLGAEPTSVEPRPS